MRAAHLPLLLNSLARAPYPLLIALDRSGPAGESTERTAMLAGAPATGKVA